MLRKMAARGLLVRLLGLDEIDVALMEINFFLQY